MSESTESRFEKWIKESDWAEELWVDGRESALHQRIMAAVAKTPQQKPDEPTQREVLATLAARSSRSLNFVVDGVVRLGALMVKLFKVAFGVFGFGEGFAKFEQGPKISPQFCVRQLKISLVI